MSDIVIRAATEDDLEALRAIAESTFRETFTADNRPADLEAYVARAFGSAQIEAELRDPGSTFILAWKDSDRGPIGYGKLRAGAAHASVTGPDPIEIERIYVSARAIGLGVGSALMRALMDRARDKSHATVWLGVWERNLNAIGFYRRWGFEVVGSHTFQLGSDAQKDLIMTRRVESVPRSLAADRGN